MYLQEVERAYNKKDIIMIDGDDHELILESVAKKGTYFKRELYFERSDVKPISMAVPDSILQAGVNTVKTKLFATVYPGKPETYIFKSEQPYYEDYQKSYYGVTMKKAGWDCMRHYEILGNYCMPYFIGLEDCPGGTLANLPKELLLDGRELANNFDEQKYFRILNEVFDYTKENLTTKSIANYILNKI
jgi:hypothetical protein